MDLTDVLRRLEVVMRETQELEREAQALMQATPIDETATDRAQRRWGMFLEEHPELTQPARLQFTDEDVYAALVEIHSQPPLDECSSEQRVEFSFPCASGVRRLLLQQ